MRPAVFLDRDGTVIEQVHYLRDPADVKLIPGAPEAVRLLRGAGYACVVVTNQSAIGRGLLTIEGLERIHQEVHRQLAEHGTQLDGVYFCPAVPVDGDRSVVEHPDRKPGPGMLLRAAEDLDLDLSRSWMVGDMLSDLLAGRNAGSQATILLKTGYGNTVQEDHGAVDLVAPNLLGAAHVILQRIRDFARAHEMRRRLR